MKPLGSKLLTAHTCVNRKMAKSIRSKRKRKLRAKRREKLKPKVKAKLEEILGIRDKEMIVETEVFEEDKKEEKVQGETLVNQEDKTVDADTIGKPEITVFNVVKVIVTATPCKVWAQGDLANPPLPTTLPCGYRPSFCILRKACLQKLCGLY